MIVSESRCVVPETIVRMTLRYLKTQAGSLGCMMIQRSKMHVACPKVRCDERYQRNALASGPCRQMNVSRVIIASIRRGLDGVCGGFSYLTCLSCPAFCFEFCAYISSWLASISNELIERFRLYCSKSFLKPWRWTITSWYQLMGYEHVSLLPKMLQKSYC